LIFYGVAALFMSFFMNHNFRSRQAIIAREKMFKYQKQML
jgi:hypothetical protein